MQVIGKQITMHKDKGNQKVGVISKESLPKDRISEWGVRILHLNCRISLGVCIDCPITQKPLRWFEQGLGKD